MQQKTMLLIYNPTSGQQMFPLNLSEVVNQFTQNGFLVTVYPTQAQKDAYRMVLERGTEYDTLVCSGGDGTLNEVIDALMRLERRPTFGYLPSGTTNDFAASLGIPRDVLQAAAAITGGEARPFDIGLFGDKPFSYVAAFGLFTDVSYGTSQGMKNALGHLAYLMEGAKRLGSIQAYSCAVKLGTEKLSGRFIFGMVTNSLSVGGFRIHREGSVVRMDDGQFEVMLLRKPRSFIDLQNVIASILNQELYTDSLIVRQASELTFVSEEPLSWTLDGEFGGELSDVRIRNIHNAFEIMMPRADG